MAHEVRKMRIFRHDARRLDTGVAALQWPLVVSRSCGPRIKAGAKHDVIQQTYTNSTVTVIETWTSILFCSKTARAGFARDLLAYPIVEEVRHLHLLGAHELALLLELREHLCARREREHRGSIRGGFLCRFTVSVFESVLDCFYCEYSQ